MADKDSARHPSKAEASVARPRDKVTYDGYLQLDTLLSAQHPVSDPPHHDEMLFIVQHQVAELWFKLLLHELDAAIVCLREDRARRALKILSRIREIQIQLSNQWSVLATLTPSEYAEFRRFFGSASGFQSPQYRLVEFKLGQKNPAMLALFRHNFELHRKMRDALAAPGLYDEFLAYLHRQGHVMPPECLERDWTAPYAELAGVTDALQRIYEQPDEYWLEYQLCERFVDLQSNFQQWRFRHMKTVERIIGFKRGTGGSAGVAFLKRALEAEFFPELIAVRTQIRDL